jgi:hypothetical protein
LDFGFSTKLTSLWLRVKEVPWTTKS